MQVSGTNDFSSEMQCGEKLKDVRYKQLRLSSIAVLAIQMMLKARFCGGIVRRRETLVQTMDYIYHRYNRRGKGVESVIIIVIRQAIQLKNSRKQRGVRKKIIQGVASGDWRRKNKIQSRYQGHKLSQGVCRKKMRIRSFVT